MKKTNYLRRLLSFLLLVAIAATVGSCASKDDDSKSDTNTTEDEGHTCGSATFTSDTFTAGSINAQNGWDVDPTVGFDEAIVNLGSSGACRGNGVWKIVNVPHSTAFTNQPASPTFTKLNGESTVRSSGGGDSFSISFFFKAVSPSADGSTFTVSISPTVKDRMTYFRFENDIDGDGGFKIWSTDGNWATDHTLIASLDRSKWHHFKAELNAVDGASNDVVKVYIDGNLVSTQTSLEDGYGSTQTMTRVMFRMSVPPADIDSSLTNPLGFYIDDFTQKSFNQATPTTFIEEYKTGFEL